MSADPKTAQTMRALRKPARGVHALVQIGRAHV